MSGLSSDEQLRQRVRQWADAAETPLPRSIDDGADWIRSFLTPADHEPLRSGAPTAVIRSWERRFGYRLPRGLRSWLILSNGLYSPTGPLIHPLSAIGPMIPFARVPGLVVQPESWFELGNPGRETICIDLGYSWPDGDCPVFLSGDDDLGTQPRVIAPSFTDWLTKLLVEGGREFWFDPGFRALGHPWTAHRRHAPAPPLPDRLKPLADRALPLMRTGADDRSVASMLGVSTNDVEALFRHLQHATLH